MSIGLIYLHTMIQILNDAGEDWALGFGISIHFK